MCAILLAVTLVAAPSGAGPDLAPATAAPEERAVDALDLQPFEARWELLLVEGGRPQAVGTVTARLDAGELGGEPTLSYTRFSDDPLGSVWQQVVLRRSDLAPVSHRTTTGAGGALRLEYDGPRVSGTRTETVLGGEEEPVQAQLEAGTFDVTVLGLVLRSLPLADGYRARIPVYGPGESEEGAVWADVAVKGRESVADAAGRQAEAWVVDVALQGTPSSRFWIIESAPYVARRLIRSGGIEFRLVEPEEPS